MDTLAFVLIVVLLLLIILALIIFTVQISKGKNHSRSEVHFSGGANLDNGRLSSDNNYFKGVSGALVDTVVVDENRRTATDFGFYITIKNRANGHCDKAVINGQLIIGRGVEKDTYTLNDKFVSIHHCRLTVKNGRLFLDDLNSSNHTYLNGEQLHNTAEIHSGDTIKLGNTRLEIIY